MNNDDAWRIERAINRVGEALGAPSDPNETMVKRKVVASKDVVVNMYGTQEEIDEHGSMFDKTIEEVFSGLGSQIAANGGYDINKSYELRIHQGDENSTIGVLHSVAIASNLATYSIIEPIIPSDQVAVGYLVLGTSGELYVFMHAIASRNSDGDENPATLTATERRSLAEKTILTGLNKIEVVEIG